MEEGKVMRMVSCVVHHQYMMMTDYSQANGGLWGLLDEEEEEEEEEEEHH